MYRSDSYKNQFISDLKSIIFISKTKQYHGIQIAR